MGKVDSPLVVTRRELSKILRLSSATIDRHVARGLPCVDVSLSRPGRRPKRALRFEVGRVLSYFAERSDGDRGAA